MRREWEDAEFATVAAMLKANCKLQAIANKLGRTKRSISHGLRLMGIKMKPAPRRWTKAEIARVLRFHKKGLSQKDIADREGRTISVVHRLLRKLGVVGKVRGTKRCGSSAACSAAAAT